MTHPLENRVAQLTRRVRRLRWTWAMSCAAACLLAAVLVLGLADYLIRSSDFGLRVLASLAVVGAIAGACVRYLLPVWRRTSTPLAMAQQIERRYPDLDDRLASSLEFLRTADHATAGSHELRESVIRETTAQLDNVDFGELISPYAVRRAVAAALLLAAFMAVLFVLDASSTRLAVARLAQPWRALPWPQLHHLEFRNVPAQVATGTDLEVELTDGNGVELPDDIQVHFRAVPSTARSQDHGKEDRASEAANPKKFVPQTSLTAGGAMLVRLENVRESLEYRATGGDDHSMPWHRLDVIDPPRIASIEVMLYPPAYTGWQPYRGERRIRAYQGTRVAMAGRLTKPVREVRLHQPDHPPLIATLNDTGDEFSFAADANARTPLVVEKSSPYWLELDDLAHQGLVGGRDDRWNIIAIADQKPTIVFEQPSHDLTVVADALVPLRIVVKDDLRTQAVDLRFRLAQERNSNSRQIRLMEAPPATAAAAGSAASSGDQHTINYAWHLGELNLSPGSELLISAVASDFKQQQAASSLRRVRIVKPAELLEQIASRQAAILTDLARGKQLQIQAREKATTTRIQLEEVQQVDATTIDRTQAALLSQQQVERIFADPTDGILATIDAALADLSNNHLEREQTTEQLGEIAQAVRRLADKVLPVAHRQLSSARQVAQASDGSEQSAAAGNIVAKLSAVDAAQQEVIATLDQILGKRAEWSDFHQLYRDIARIKATQEKLLKQADKLRATTVGRRWEQLDPQQQADLKKLSFSQTDLSRQVETVHAELRAAAKQASADNDSDNNLDASDFRAALADATRVADQANIVTKMQDAGDSLAANRVATATETQKSVIDSLGELLDALANRREQRIGRLVELLRAAERELQALRSRQERLRKRLADTRTHDQGEQQRELQQLVEQQLKLKKDVEQFAHQLRRLEAGRASRTAARSTKRMASAAAAGQSGNAGGAESMAQAAAEDLAQASHELAARRQAAEMDLAVEQMVSLAQTLTQLIERQQAVLHETQQIENAGADRLRQFVALARRQQAIGEETTTAATLLSTLPIVRSTLEGAAEQMKLAATLLDSRQAGEQAEQVEQAEWAEREALRQLNDVMQALTPDLKHAGGSTASPGGGGGAPTSGARLVNVAELRLVIIMQERLANRTAELEKQRATSVQLNAAQRAEYHQLKTQQAELAEWILKLTEPAEPPPPDSLPQDEPPGIKSDPDPEPTEEADPESIKELLPSFLEDRAAF